MSAGPPRPPSFLELLVANLRVLSVIALVVLASYGLWRAAAWLFPDVAWLQSGS